MCCRCCNIKTAAKQPSQFKKNWMKYRIPLTIFGILHIILAVIIALAEFTNELQDFWYTNVFGGFWVSFILFITTVVLFVSGLQKNLTDKLPPLQLKQKVKQPEPPAIVASMEYISDEMLKPPKDSQLPPWPIVGPTIGPILGAPPPF
ncbi:unnamed protein product [Rotaria magnacalcarata]|uniref:Uncharacterized protein n=1 Tax=Rotaria magnacalcarata TaxID=392030 RepID=A0A816LHA0_9BILA|nr:unnamed protein product [Rotaria magnacalcarata]